MNKVRQEKEEKGTAKKPGSRGHALPRAFISVLNGSFLTRENVLRNMPFILWCAGLMVVYISYGYHTERVVRELQRSTEAVKEMRLDHLSTQAALEEEERQSRVAMRIRELGLRESLDPPAVVNVSEDELESTRRQ